MSPEINSSGGSSAEHIELTKLVSYQEGRLSEAEESAVQSHLVGCRACADLLLDLCDFMEERGSPSDRSQSAVRRLAAGLLGGAPRQTRAPGGSYGWWRRLAAALAAVAIGLVGFAIGRYTGDRGKSRAIESLSSVELFESAGRQIRERDASSAVPLPEGMLAVLLMPREHQRLPVYEVRLVREGVAVFDPKRIAPDRTGTFKLGLHGRDLVAGSYRFELWGGGDARSLRKIAEFELRLEGFEEP